MICGRFGPMRKEIVPDIFSLWRDSRRQTWSGRRLHAGGGCAPYRSFSVAIGRRSGANGSATLGASVGVCFQLGGASPGVSLPCFHLFRYS